MNCQDVPVYADTSFQCRDSIVPTPHQFPASYKFHEAVQHLQTVNKFTGVETARRIGCGQAEYSKSRRGHSLPAPHWVPKYASGLGCDEATLQAAYDKSDAERIGPRRAMTRPAKVRRKKTVSRRATVVTKSPNRIAQLESKIDALTVQMKRLVDAYL